MRYVSFEYQGRTSWGQVDGDFIVDIGAMEGAPPNLRAALTTDLLRPQGIERGSRVARSDVRLLPVIPNPSKVLCVGHNYETHRQETGRAKVDNPSIFTRFPDTLIGANDPIVRPRVSTSLDYEGELAVVIGKEGRYIAEADAMSHVAGYACFNDGSVRDWQWHTTQFTPGKNFPNTAPFGPELVTPDEIERLDAVRVETLLNSEVMQSATIDLMIFSIPRVIAYISSFTRLAPGDVIATGTPGGVGAKRNPPVWLKPGDEVEVRISGIGSLKNRIVDEP